MNITMPAPIVKCSKCGSVDIVRPERPVNREERDGDVLLRCRSCGHEKRADHKQRFDDLMTRSAVTMTFTKEETF